MSPPPDLRESESDGAAGNTNLERRGSPSDLYTRMHAASKAGAVGGGLNLLAVAVLRQDAAAAMGAVIGVVFPLLTTPVSAHLLARASYISGYKPCNETLIDQLATNNEQNPAT
ncbi:monovalent cation/H(+) antiporter subunit G [Devosia sp. CAU 1758]